MTLGVCVVLTTFLAVAGLIFGDFGEGLGKAIGSSMARLVRGLISATNVFIAFAAFLLSVFTLAIENVGADFLTLVASVFLIDLMLNVLVPIARHASPATDYRVDAATPVPARRQGADPDYGIEASRSRAVP